LAIIKRSDSEMASVTADQDSIGTQEPPGEPAAESAPPPQAAGLRSMTQALPSALEPELRRIIDTAVARVAAIELEAIRDARELTQRSEQEAREALKFALDRAFNLIATLELLAATVGGMAEALKIELDDAIEVLRNVPEPESALARELAQSAPAQEPTAQEPTAQEPPAPAPAAAETAEAPQPGPAAAHPPGPEPQAAVSDAVPAEPEPETASAPEPPPEESPAPEEPAPAEAPTPTARSNGYPPAERQAESLAEASGAQKHEPQRTVVPAPASEDGKPAVPPRRRGIMRRLLSK
jgi:hypothetical protein